MAKKILVIDSSMSSDAYEQCPLDHQITHLGVLFRFLEMKDIQMLQADNLYQVPELHEHSLALTDTHVQRMLSSYWPATRG